MARQLRQSFSPTGEYIARKDFRFAGRAYKAGAPFPWRKLSCSTRRLHQLWEGRYLELKGTDLPYKEVEEEEVVVDTDKSEESTQDEETEEVEAESEDETEEEEETEEVEALTGVFTFDPEIHSIANPQRGTWIIMQEDKALTTLPAKLAKKLRNADEPVEIDLG